MKVYMVIYDTHIAMCLTPFEEQQHPGGSSYHWPKGSKIDSNGGWLDKQIYEEVYAYLRKNYLKETQIELEL
jgi:hypothetical protein